MKPQAIQTLLSCGLALAVASSVTAQQPATTQLAATQLAKTQSGSAAPNFAAVTTQSFGMDVVDGELRAGGPRYKALLDQSGIEFTPALGAAAVTNYPVHFRVTSIRRGETVAYNHLTAPRVAPQQKGMVASYARGNGIVETYEARVDGIKQNFTFAGKPEGAGDLLVEGRLTTTLAASQLGANDRGLMLQVPGIGGVQFGAVVGIDAFGNRANGGLSYDGELVRFTLPSAYVDNAAYPLVLDPLISTITSVNTSPAADPDVAFDETFDDYLVVWEHQFSQADIDVCGQKVDTAGALVATAIFITNEFGNEINPAVGNVDTGSDYFVAYQDGDSLFGPWNIRGRRVDGGTVTTTSALIDVAATTANEITPDVSGDNSAISGVNDGVIVVFDDSTGISAVKVDLSSMTVVAGPITLDSSANATNPAISKSGGAVGRHMVVWQQDYTTDRDVQGALVDRDLNVLDASISIAGGIPDDEFNADVDGDGDVFLAVFQEHEGGLTGPSDIYCRRFAWNGSSVNSSGAAQVVEGAINVDERDPAIGNLGLKYVASWAAEDVLFPLDYDIAFLEINPDNCLACGVRQLSQGGAINIVDIKPAIATRYSGRASNNPVTLDQGLIVWMDAESAPPFDSNVVGNLYEAFDGGVVTNLGGACGNGGTNGFNGPVALGNSNLRLTVTGASSNLTLVSIMFSNSTVPCGPCQINSSGPSFLSAFGTGGNSSFALPIPCNTVFLGSQLYTQWASVFSGANPCAILPANLQMSFSNRLNVTIGT